MALSNIFREPRREITETAIGMAVVVPFVMADYYFGKFVASACDDCGAAGIPIGMLIGLIGGIIVAAVLALIAIGIHTLGEDICDSLQERGVHLRPRQRRGHNE